MTGYEQRHADVEHILGYETAPDPLFYEGDDPEGFCADMRAEFGFDPSAWLGWGQWITWDEAEAVEHGEEGFYSWEFWPPAEHYEALHHHSGGRWPIGC
jgi:hypothetical protein